MILGAAYRSPGICLTAEETPKKPQQGDRLMKGLCDHSLSQMGPFPPNDVSSFIETHQGSKMKAGRKEGKRYRVGVHRIENKNKCTF